ncbi:MAG: glycosyltransferase family 4 protein [Candidatus Aminicenantes bacterium]|nr:glycosyltransferase family 4 protein [Candidatus Aminicenantes bacterium]
MIIEQFLPNLHDGDAVGNSTLALHRFLLSRGVESRIIAMDCDPAVRDQATLFSDYHLDPGALKILHFAIPSPLSDFFLGLQGKKVMIYHNITPSYFFAGYSDDLVRITAAGREQLKKLDQCFDLAVGDSTYNAKELRELGFANVHVFPLLVNLQDYDHPINGAYADLLKNERKNIVFAGRVSPNKKIEDLIKTVFFYKKYISPAVRLIIAGNTGSLPKYTIALQNLASRFHLTSEDVFFTGHLPLDEFLAVYRSADVFLSMSEHEGFCLPLLESCYFKVPVVAFDAAAVAETLDGAGLLFRDKAPALAAGLVEQVLEKEPLRRQLQVKAVERIGRYRLQADPDILLSMLKQL